VAVVARKSLYCNVRADIPVPARPFSPGTSAACSCVLDGRLVKPGRPPPITAPSVQVGAHPGWTWPLPNTASAGLHIFRVNDFGSGDARSRAQVLRTRVL